MRSDKLYQVLDSKRTSVENALYPSTCEQASILLLFVGDVLKVEAGVGNRVYFISEIRWTSQI